MLIESESTHQRTVQYVVLFTQIHVVWEPLRETASQTTHQGKFVHSHLSLLSQCELIQARGVKLACAS